MTSRACAPGLATALRMGIIDVSTARHAAQGQQTKAELLYDYMASPEFHHRIEGIVEPFCAMKQELEAERRAVQHLWAKREKQLERAMVSAVGLHGDLSGIMGSSVPAMDAVSLLRLPEATPDSEEPGEARGFSVTP